MPASRPDLNMEVVPYTEAMENEALAREAEQVAGQGVEDNLDTGAGGEQVEQARIEPETNERKVIHGSPQDAKRAAIAARFKANDEGAFDGDMNRPENLYGDAAREQLEPEPTGEGGDPVLGDVQPQRQEQQPAKRKLTVRGQTVEMTDDEIIAAAQKTLAGDSYLEDARALLAEAKEIKAERTGRDRQHPDGQSRTQDDEQDATRNDGSQHPEDELEAVVDQLQFGDRKEAAKLLGQAVRKEAGKIVTEDHQSRLFNNDLARSQKALADFKAANPELATDEIAGLAIEKTMYNLYREDIIALGLVDEAQIPTDPRTLANWHRFYKINGHTVRNTPDLLNLAKEKFVAWRGTSNKPPQPAQRKEPGRVEVSVNRDTRRASIPLQPSRAVAPRRDAVVTPKTTTDSDVVRNMRRARGQPVA